MEDGLNILGGVSIDVFELAVVASERSVEQVSLEDDELVVTPELALSMENVLNIGEGSRGRCGGPLLSERRWVSNFGRVGADGLLNSTFRSPPDFEKRKRGTGLGGADIFFSATAASRGRGGDEAGEIEGGDGDGQRNFLSSSDDDSSQSDIFGISFFCIIALALGMLLLRRRTYLGVAIMELARGGGWKDDSMLPLKLSKLALKSIKESESSWAAGN